MSIFLSSSFLPLLFFFFCCPLYRLSYALRKYNFNLPRVVGEKAKLAVDFPQNITCFFVCNCVRIGQNFQNELSIGERSIFVYVAIYQLGSLN